MYVKSNTSWNLGCSVRELTLGYAPTAREIEKFKKEHPSLTIAVTNKGYQQTAEQELEKAGFIRIATYKNRAYGHRGNLCSLWIGADKSNLVEVAGKVVAEKPKITVKRGKDGRFVSVKKKGKK
jgi:hypothetical protein